MSESSDEGGSATGAEVASVIKTNVVNMHQQLVYIKGK